MRGARTWIHSLIAGWENKSKGLKSNEDFMVDFTLNAQSPARSKTR